MSVARAAHCEVAQAFFLFRVTFCIDVGGSLVYTALNKQEGLIGGHWPRILAPCKGGARWSVTDFQTKGVPAEVDPT